MRNHHTDLLAGSQSKPAIMIRMLRNEKGHFAEYASKQVLDRLLKHGGRWWPPPDQISRSAYYFNWRQTAFQIAERKKLAAKRQGSVVLMDAKVWGLGFGVQGLGFRV